MVMIFTELNMFYTFLKCFFTGRIHTLHFRAFLVFVQLWPM